MTWEVFSCKKNQGSKNVSLGGSSLKVDWPKLKRLQSQGSHMASHLISAAPWPPGWSRWEEWAARLCWAAPPPQGSTGGTWWPWGPVWCPWRFPEGCRWSRPWRQSRGRTAGHTHKDKKKKKVSQWVKSWLKLLSLASVNWILHWLFKCLVLYAHPLAGTGHPYKGTLQSKMATGQ